MRWRVALVVLAAVVAAVAGNLLPVPVGLAVALLVGAGAAAAVSAGLRRRDDGVAAVLHALGAGAAPPEGAALPARVEAAVDAVAAALEERRRGVQREHDRVERLVESLPVAVVLFTAGRMAYANPVARELFGLPAGELSTSGRTPLQVLGVDGLAGAVVEAREAGRTVDVEVRREDRELIGRAFPSGTDTTALVVSDLTESRRLEAVRRDFVTNASHELKTPVAGMQALADSLAVAVDRDPQRVRPMLARVQHEAVRLAQLVRDLLDLARLEEDAPAESGRRRVDLAEVVREQVEQLGVLADERDVTLTVHSDAAAPLAAVPADVRLIVANLLENAIRYNRPGGAVTVTVRRGAAAVALEVADNGIGIPEADRDRVFERFYRVDKGRSRAAGGTGLGLAIVRHAAQRHGGDVTVRSVLGEGSTFRVVLPVEGSPPQR